MPEDCYLGPMISTPSELPIHRYVFPIQMIILLFMAFHVIRKRISGQPSIVTERTILLLGTADFCFLLTLLPQSLATFPAFYSRESYRRIYHSSKISVNALSNFFSAIEVYLTVAICAECYLRSHRSTYTKIFTRKWSNNCMLMIIFIWSFIVSSYHFALYDLKTGFQCNDTKMVSKLIMSTFFSEELVVFLKINQALTIIFIPCIMVLYFNHKLCKLIKSEALPLIERNYQDIYRCHYHLAVIKKQALFNLTLMSLSFTVSHVFSFFPFLYDINPNFYGYQYSTIITAVLNSFLVSGKLLTLYLIYKICNQLNSIGFFPTIY